MSRLFEVRLASDRRTEAHHRRKYGFRQKTIRQSFTISQTSVVPLFMRDTSITNSLFSSSNRSCTAQVLNFLEHPESGLALLTHDEACRDHR